MEPEPEPEPEQFLQLGEWVQRLALQPGLVPKITSNLSKLSHNSQAIADC